MSTRKKLVSDSVVPIGVGALVFLIVTTITFVFPPFVPVISGQEMNYVIVVVAIVSILCAGAWISHGRKHYIGPWELERRVQTARLL